jgi:hypothetical protein
MKGLNEGQSLALRLLAVGHLSHAAAKSMPSLERRGLTERYWVHADGRRYRSWRLTATGRDLAGRLAKASPVVLIITSDGEERVARTHEDGSWSCPWCGAPNIPSEGHYQRRGWPWPCANPGCIVGGKGNPSAVAMIRAGWARQQAERDATAARQRFADQYAAEQTAARLARCDEARALSQAEGWCYACWAHSTANGLVQRDGGFRPKHYKPGNCPRLGK